jgi:hypothetical protein
MGTHAERAPDTQFTSVADGRGNAITRGNLYGTEVLVQ